MNTVVIEARERGDAWRAVARCGRAGASVFLARVRRACGVEFRLREESRDASRVGIPAREKEGVRHAD